MPLSRKKSDRLSYYLCQMQIWISANLFLTSYTRRKGVVVDYIYSTNDYGLYSNTLTRFISLVIEITLDSDDMQKIDTMAIIISDKKFNISSKETLSEAITYLSSIL